MKSLHVVCPCGVEHTWSDLDVCRTIRHTCDRCGNTHDQPERNGYPRNAVLPEQWVEAFNLEANRTLHYCGSECFSEGFFPSPNERWHVQVGAAVWSTSSDGTLTPA